MSLGEKAAPNGLCNSVRFCGDALEGLAASFMLFCDGGVVPELNLELKLDIHELRLGVLPGLELDDLLAIGIDAVAGGAVCCLGSVGAGDSGLGFDA